MSMQTNWRWCRNCQALVWGGNPTPGKCPAGGQHDRTGSGNYALQANAQAAPGWQDSWRWCNKCQSLCYAGSSNPGPCAAGTTHDYSGSGAYLLSIDAKNDSGEVQPDWRWCSKCQQLIYGPVSASSCAGGGTHDTSGSGSYRLNVVHDRKVYTLTPWPSNTVVPDGTLVAIQYGHAEVNGSGTLIDWWKFFGIGADGVIMDALDADIAERDVFTVEMYSPQRRGVLNLGLPWFRLRAANGQYVGSTDDATGRMAAKFDGDHATIFMMSNHEIKDAFTRAPDPWRWKDREELFNRFSGAQDYTVYPLCAYAPARDHVSTWTTGYPPNFLPSGAGKVNFYTVTISIT